MKTILMTIAALTFSSSAFAGNPWARYVGCYQTIAVNGKPVESYSVLSTVKEDLATYFADAKTKEPIPAVNISPAYFDSNSNELMMDEGNAFNDRGSFKVDSKGEHYKFSGKLAYRPNPKYMGTLQSTIDLAVDAAGNLVVRILRKIPAASKYNGNHIYVMKPVSCS